MSRVCYHLIWDKIKTYIYLLFIAEVKSDLYWKVIVNWININSNLFINSMNFVQFERDSFGVWSPNLAEIYSFQDSVYILWYQL